MTSRRPRQDRPIESVELKIKFRADRELSARIRQEIPSAVVNGGQCEVVIGGLEAGEVAEEARALLEKLRKILESPKRL